MTISDNKSNRRPYMSDTLNRLNKLSGYAGLFAKIVMMLLIIAVIGGCVLLALTFADPDLIIDNVPEATSIGYAQATALNIITGAAVLFPIMYFINRFFMNIHKSNVVFTYTNVRDLRTVALLIVVLAVVMTVVVSLTTYFLLNAEDIVVGFSPLTMLLTAFIVYVLSLIFSHGADLQRESDETL